MTLKKAIKEFLAINTLTNICQLLKDAYSRNWITSRDGNISWHPEGADYFYITPSGVRKQDMTPELFKKIDIATLQELDDNYGVRPSGEIHLHHRLLKQTRQEQCVVHLHPTYIVAAMQTLELSELVADFPEISRYTRVANNVGMVPPISEELAEQCISKLGKDRDIVGIKAHGAVSRGNTVYDAYEHIERLEHICKIVLVGRTV